MVGIIWEISVTRLIVLLLSVVALHMVSWVVNRVFIMVNSSGLIKIIVASIAHWVVIVEKVGIVPRLVKPLRVTSLTSWIRKTMLVVLLISVFIAPLIFAVLLLVSSGFRLRALVLPFVLSFLMLFPSLGLLPMLLLLLPFLLFL